MYAARIGTQAEGKIYILNWRFLFRDESPRKKILSAIFVERDQRRDFRELLRSVVKTHKKNSKKFIEKCLSEKDTFFLNTNRHLIVRFLRENVFSDISTKQTFWLLCAIPFHFFAIFRFAFNFFVTCQFHHYPPQSSPRIAISFTLHS